MIRIPNFIRLTRLGLPTWERVFYCRSDEPAKRAVSRKSSGLYGRFKTPYSGRLEALRASSLSGQDFKPTIQAGGVAAYSLLGVPHPRLKLVAESRFIKVLDKYWKLDYTNLVNEKYYQLFQRKKMKSDAIDNDERRRAQCYPQSRR